MPTSKHNLGVGERRSAVDIRVSCSLINSAGEMAADIAELFEFPHFDFLALSPARMHLIGIAVAGIHADAIDFEQLTAKRWIDAVRILADPYPIGLHGILASLTFPLWPAASYRTLWNVLQCAKAKKILTHTKTISPILVSILDELRPALRAEKVVRHLRRPIEVAVLARICDDDIKAETLLRMLRHVERRADFFAKLVEFVDRSTVFPIPPHIDHDLIEPIWNARQLSDVAIRFRNCLRSFIDEVAAGKVAFYVLGGPEPAVFSIEPRIGGYVITEVRGMRNSSVSNATMSLIHTALTSSGIRVLDDDCRHSRIKWNLERLRSIECDDHHGIDRACRQLLATEDDGPEL
ncbi:hypothetical protein [Hyphomonas johnsonii]|uniref:Uncharacterized protein n=1 Tax=Hyphomonas johnsonii MHS-2 TaxID=1280950 RepID=A0A059FS70_9PROT|nr:hypothetical protein [Hyphomonas johnsonii]KCZ93505.1 hypothetical protein HJO_06610 [Hyphomonas johnsonii MHS-2]